MGHGALGIGHWALGIGYQLFSKLMCVQVAYLLAKTVINHLSCVLCKYF
ncbi:hypothetical protein [aff. Roholtiella sp. LEGE 12411]|nr:hypothetical protein [aff. Roholtiella sp. LEGE 12411]